MNPSYIAILMLLLVVYLTRQRQKRQTAARRIISKKKKGGRKMTALLNEYLGKEVILYTLNDQVAGRIVEINEGWLKLDSGREVSTINMDYVIRVREKLPKPGKKDQ